MLKEMTKRTGFNVVDNIYIAFAVLKLLTVLGMWYISMQVKDSVSCVLITSNFSVQLLRSCIRNLVLML